MLHGLDLFSGIGGLSMALSPWVRPIAYCENDRYAQAVLLSRMQSGDLPAAPIWDDVTTLLPSMLPRNGIDIIYGGFPCQDISVAGARRGLEGKRSGLFFEIVRLARELRPAFLFLENVAGIRTKGLDTVAEQITELGYDCRWTIVSAAEVGAPHQRKRWWLLAHTKSIRRNQCGRETGNFSQEDERQNRSLCSEFIGSSETTTNLAHANSCGELQQEGSEQIERRRLSNCGEEVSNTHRERLEKWKRENSERAGANVRQKPGGVRDWPTEPAVGRVANGVSHRAHRIKGLGNAVVPQQAREAFIRLMTLGEKQND